jgi:hypothetical protein
MEENHESTVEASRTGVKILEDKLTVYPPHALCRADVRMIMSSVPAKWSEGVETVKLSAQQANIPIVKYNRFNKTFTISSRGQTKEHTLHQVLVRLAAHGLGLQLRGWERLQERDVSKVEKLVAPLFEELLPNLSKKKVWLDK